MNGTAKARRRQRGASLIEVLIAFFLFMVISLAILQLLSLSVLVNTTALARTDLQSRAQQVVESIRMVNIIQRAGGATTNSLVPNPLGETTAAVQIPDDPAHLFWGRNGMNVIEPNARYLLSFDIADGETAGDNRVWVITVTAAPKATGHTYAGQAIPRKVVRYVAQIPKA